MLLTNDSLGTPERLFEEYYMQYCEKAFEDFGNFHWPCAFSEPYSRNESASMLPLATMPKAIKTRKERSLRMGTSKLPLTTIMKCSRGPRAYKEN